MPDERTFPLLLSYAEGQTVARKRVPWSLVAPFEARAQKNHAQSLDTLARRGGLSPAEMYYLLHDVRWPGHDIVSTHEAMAYIEAEIRKHA
jgi:hypothetical protein